MGKWMLTILILIGSALLTHFLPFSDFFRNLDTMIHESGHALTTLLLQGSVMEIELYVDHSGVTRSAVSQPWAIIPIALSGYMMASLFAWLLFVLYAKGKHKAGLITMAALAAVTLVLFVRNEFGVLWLLGFLVFTVLVILFGGNNVIGKWVFLIIAFLTLEESVFGPFSLVYYALNRPGGAGDATILSGATPLPAIVWAVWFTLFALWCAKQAITAFLGGKRKRERPARSFG
ncbi:M50 family metallopeptidase [Paenibacillus sp. MBLB4367]|uniref:M50 family metallopeptidase n=1 Tax=Paenibacillus sp. MBLB4367 TaxID=3384767 RepID=UPI0039080B23